MTEPDLITQLVNLTSDARAVLSQIAAYGTTNANITFNLSGGVTLTVPSIPSQVSQIATQLAADRLAYAKDFGGAVAGLTLTRDTAGRIATTNATLTSGYQVQMAFTRTGTPLKITSVTITVLDALNNVLYGPVVRNLNYVNNQFSSIS